MKPHADPVTLSSCDSYYFAACSFSLPLLRLLGKHILEIQINTTEQ